MTGVFADHVVARQDLRELKKRVDAGTFEPVTLEDASDEEVARGRAVLREIGAPLFSETAAGAELLGLRR